MADKYRVYKVTFFDSIILYLYIHPGENFLVGLKNLLDEWNKYDVKDVVYLYSSEYLVTTEI